MRRAKPENREILPDIRYNSVHVQTMVQHVLKRGKKSVATGLIYKAMDLIKDRIEKNPLDVFEGALRMFLPLWKFALAVWVGQHIRCLWKYQWTAAERWPSAGFCPRPANVPENPSLKSWLVN